MVFQRIRELQSALETERINESNGTIEASETNSLSDLDQNTRSITNSTNTSRSYSSLPDGSSNEASNNPTFSLPASLPTPSSTDGPTLERIAAELNSIAVDWRSYRTPVHCSCALPFDSLQRKVRTGKRHTQSFLAFF